MAQSSEPKKSLQPLVKQLQDELSRLEKLGGQSFRQGELKSALDALKSDLYKLDTTLAACSYTFGNDLKK